MARKQNRPERPRADGERTRRWPRVLAIAGGIVLALIVCVLVCLHFMLDAMGPRHAEKDHDHPPGPHGGTMVAVGRESHFHVEAVFERSGQVRVYTYGGDETQVHPIDAQPVPAKVRRPPDALYIGVGFAVGLVMLFIGATGPLSAVVFKRDDWPPLRVVATMAVAQAVAHAFKLPAFSGPTGSGAVLFVIGVYLAGILWYLAAKAIQKRRGIDLDLLYREIPPE